MKILLVLEQYDGANNGNTMTARRLAETAQKHGHEVRIAATGETRADKYGFKEFKVPIFNNLIQAQGFKFARPNKKIMAEAVQWADIVHVMMPFPLSKCAWKQARKFNKPTTAAFHVQPENIWFSVGLGNCKPLINFTYWLGRVYLFKHYSHIHCPSKMIANQLISHKYKAQLHIISNGIDDSFVYHKVDKSPELQGKFVITMSGRLSKEKRQDVLIEAVRKSKYSDRIQLFLAGQGPVRNLYEKMGSTLPNPIIMKFLTKDQLIATLGMTDLYVHASDAEIEAISCMEAFASGLVPIIANSPRSATPQFALDERSLFEPGSSEDLAKKIDWWYEHEAERKEMEYVYAQSAKQYGLDYCVKKMEELFQLQIDENKLDEN